MSAADAMRALAVAAPKNLPEGIGDLYDGVVKSVHECATKGMRGMNLTLEVPVHLTDFLPHVVGDIRSGGFYVDIIAYEPSNMGRGEMITLFVTW